MLKIAEIKGTSVEVPPKIALLVALIAAAPALVTALTDYALKPEAQEMTSALEQAKLSLEQRKASASLYRAALLNPDAAQRHQAVQFLLDAGLVENNPVVKSKTAEQLPHWPASAAANP